MRNSIDSRCFATRYPELFYSRLDRTTWRFFFREYDGRFVGIGPQYRSKAELLSDVERYATEYGLNSTDL